jgi:hypothetical protein
MTKKEVKKVLDLLIEMEKSTRKHSKEVKDDTMRLYHYGKADGFVQAWLIVNEQLNILGKAK